MANSEGKLLFGMELELGFAVLDDEGKQLDATSALGSYLKVCSKKFLHLSGRDCTHLYLANGSLVYPDVGHPEFATAESPSPVSLLQSLRAGEGMMADAAEELESQPGISEVNLYRTNVDYSSIGTTWGCHESYLARRPPADFAPRVVDHLVSRLIYSGSGGFNNQSYGAAFVLSPRVAHLSSKIGRDSRGRRAIFSLREESLSNVGYHRVHLICGEPNFSELSTYLKVGTTALVIAMADANVDFGMREKLLTSPVDAIGLFSLNPDCKKQASCDDGNRRSAIDIQRNYLELAEKNLAAPFMPEWAEDVCVKWRKALDQLASDPETLIGSLDWPTKLAVFKQHVHARSTLSWSSLPVWTSVAMRVSRALSTKTDAWPRIESHQVKAFLGTKGAIARLLKNLTSMLVEHGLDWDELDAFYDLRDQLCELDLRYGQLYPRGIYLDLEEAGRIRGGILEAGQIEKAIDRAPTEGRARVRGDWVRRLANSKDKYYSSWTCISGNSKYIDLGDPFVTEADWRTAERGQTLRNRSDEPDMDIPAFLTESAQNRLFD